MEAVVSDVALEVRRGPGWLIVKLRDPGVDSTQRPSLAEALWSLMESHLVHRLAVEVGEVTRLDRRLVAQLMWLNRRIRQHGGVLRVCGVSQAHRKVLEKLGLNGCLPIYEDFQDAVLCWRQKPR